MQRKKGSILLYQTFAFLLVRVRGLELLQKRRSSAALCQNYNMRRAEFVFANKNKRVEFARLHINAKKAKQALKWCLLCFFGAGKRTWTSTKLPPLEPESSASANSAIPANCAVYWRPLYYTRWGLFCQDLLLKFFRKNFHFFWKKTWHFIKIVYNIVCCV